MSTIIKKNTIAIIMGAAVLADGNPSNAMRRRVEGALSLRSQFENLIYIPTGGVGHRKPRSEAKAMQDSLQKAGIRAECIIPEIASKDTLQSIVNCTQIIREFPGSTVVVCSDRYHILRCRLLLFLLGIPTVYQSMPSGRRANGWLRWIFFYVREAVAIPYDLSLLFGFKFFHKKLPVNKAR